MFDSRAREMYHARKLVLKHDVTKRDDQKIAVRQYSIFSFKYLFFFRCAASNNKLTSSRHLSTDSDEFLSRESSQVE